MTANPSPIPVGSTIPLLTLAARDQATNQLVNGTFTVASAGAGFSSVRSGGTLTNALIRMGHTYQTEIGPNGKPIRLAVPVCPTLTFQPDLPVFQAGDFSPLLACSNS